MICQQFKDCYNSDLLQNEDTFYLWNEHRHDCEDCGEWYMEQQAIEAGVNVQQFPCVHLAYYSKLDCNMHTDPFDCTDVLIIKTDNGLALPIRDGGSSFVNINFCPWCGIKTSKTKEKASKFRRIDI